MLCPFLRRFLCLAALCCLLAACDRPNKKEPAAKPAVGAVPEIVDEPHEEAGQPASGEQAIMDRRRITRMKGNLGLLVSYIVQYTVENRGAAPSHAAGLRALVTKHIMANDALLIDPWGEVVEYKVPAARSKDKFDVWSKGPDRISGNEDDIGNWKSAD